MATAAEMRKRALEKKSLRYADGGAVSGGLPPGFTIDEQPSQNALPAGYSVDQPKSPMSTGAALLEGYKKGASANWSDEISGAAHATGLPDWLETTLGGFAAPIGAARLAYEHMTGQPGAATEAYNKYVALARERQAQAAKEHPVATTAGELGGAGVSMLAMPGTAAATMPAKIAQGAKIGALYGGLSGAGEGTDIGSRAIGAATGAGTGAVGGAAAVPLAAGAEKVAGMAYDALGRPIAATLRGLHDPESEAARRVAGAISRDYPQVSAGTTPGLTPTEFMTAKAAGEPIALADMGGETTRALLRSSANTSPEGRAAIEGTISDRFKGQTERLANDIRSLVPGNANAVKTRAELLADYDKARIPAYKTAFAQPNAQSLWDEGFEQMAQAPSVQEAIRGAMVNAKDAAAKSGLTPPKNPFVLDQNGRFVLGQGPGGSQMTPNLQFWDTVKKNLDNIGTRESQFWAKTLRDRLDDFVPEYGAARGVASKFFGGDNALEAGENSLKFTGSADAIKQMMAKMSPAEKELFREGRASAWADKVLNMPDNIDITKRIYNSPNERARAAAVFGEPALNKIESRLMVESVMDMARKALGNSTTVRQMIEAGLAGGAIGGYLDGWRGAMEGAGAGAAAAKTGALNMARAGAQKVIGYVDQNTARNVAKLLTSDNPDDLMRGVLMVSRHKNIADGLKRIGETVAAGAGARSAATTAGPAVERSLVAPIQGPVPTRADEQQQP